ncbi:hypothetical protein [Mesorhizobium loti]|uniref:hypothetical protein n=1 Tax=Rhizobium loti TaxID=381 RepID=UPI000AAC09E7|nr:hypothetical protein [Mesorhizobium loti]
MTEKTREEIDRLWSELGLKAKTLLKDHGIDTEGLSAAELDQLQKKLAKEGKL